ncbi:MAG: PLP-dependent aminotransferase family protein [Janthinobacterium lividum]
MNASIQPATHAGAWQLSERARKLTSSAIREILKITERPDIISFAGGLPSPAAFPVARIREASQRVLTDDPAAALQYGPTEGYAPLREWVAARVSTSDVRIRASQVLITTGSQQALDLLGKVFIDPGSRLLVETPTYLGALQAFSLFEPICVPVPSDDGGLIPEALDSVMDQQPRLLYAQPNFQNPTGRRLSLARRIALTAFAERTGLPIIEDDPYGALIYRGSPLPSLLSMAPAQVIHLGSFSKVLAPGLRVGYVVAPEPILFKLVQAKQASDLHTPSLTQRIVYETVQDDFLAQHIPGVVTRYREHCDAMLAALEKHMPAGVQWNRPEGGMFIWARLPAHIDTLKLLDTAVEQAGVAFVPGAPFFAGQAEHNTLRLSFVTVPPAQIDDGIARLAALVMSLGNG